MQQLIYNQRHIPRDQWRYGFRASADIGCGWIAVYNALCILGRPVKIPELIRKFELQLPLINGCLGSFVGSPAWMLHSMGLRIRLVNNRHQYDALAKNCPVCIVSYYWRRKCRVGAHFAAFRWMDGEFIGYNTFAGSNGPDRYGPSLDAFLKKHGYFATTLTLIEPATASQNANG